MLNAECKKNWSDCRSSSPAYLYTQRVCPLLTLTVSAEPAPGLSGAASCNGRIYGRAWSIVYAWLRLLFVGYSMTLKKFPDVWKLCASITTYHSSVLFLPFSWLILWPGGYFQVHCTLLYLHSGFPDLSGKLLFFS